MLRIMTPAGGRSILRTGIDVAVFLRTFRLAEICCCAIVPEHRRNLRMAIARMRSATRETIERGFTHHITEVFENDPHGFHTRVTGFGLVAAHDHGELHCTSRRITMMLDLKAAYHRLRLRKRWIFRTLIAGCDEGLHRRFAV